MVPPKDPNHTILVLKPMVLGDSPFVLLVSQVSKNSQIHGPAAAGFRLKKCTGQTRRCRTHLLVEFARNMVISLKHIDI